MPKQTKTTTLGDYADALQFLPTEWKLQEVTNVKTCVSGGKFILFCHNYPPIFFDKGKWKEIECRNQ